MYGFAEVATWRSLLPSDDRASYRPPQLPEVHSGIDAQRRVLPMKMNRVEMVRQELPHLTYPLRILAPTTFPSLSSSATQDAADALQPVTEP